MRKTAIGLASIALTIVLGGVALRGVQPTPAVLFSTVVGPVPGSAPGSRFTPALAFDARTRRIFVTNSSGDTLTALDAGTGAIVRTLSLGPGAPDPTHALALAVDVGANHVFVADAGGTIQMLDARDGRPLLMIPVPAPAPLYLVEDVRHARVWVVGRQGSTIVVFNLDARRGLLSHAINLSPAGTTWALTSAVLDPLTGHVLVGTATSTSGTVYVLDGRTHALVRTIHIAGARWFPRVSAVDPRTGRLLITTSPHGSMLLLDGQTGRLVATRTVRAFLWAVTVDARRGRAYAIGMCDCITVLETRTGATLGTIQTAVPPSTVAVDATTGHLVVADIGGEALVQPLDVLSWLPPMIRGMLLGPLAAPPTQTKMVPPRVTLRDPHAP